MTTHRPQAQDHRMLRVLVVDDQPSFRSAMAMVLDHADGVELAATAESGEEAIDLVRAGLDVDIAVIDVHLGGIDGAVTAQRLHDADHDITTVLTSTYDVDDLPASVADSESRYLPKRGLDAEHLIEYWEHDHR